MGQKLAWDQLVYLNNLTLKWKHKPLDTFKPSVITQVYDIVISDPSDANLDILVFNQYFENVAWPWFNADLTVSHVELVLMIVLRDFPRYKYIAKEPKFRDLIVRILKMTFDVKDYRSSRLAMLFMTKLVVSGVTEDTIACLVTGSGFEPEYLVKNWLKTLVSSSIQLLYEKGQDPDVASFLRSVLQFVKALEKDHELEFPWENVNVDVPGIKPYLKPLVKCAGKSYAEYVKHQQIYYPETLEVLEGDVSRLEKLPEAELKKLLGDLNIEYSDIKVALNGLKTRIVASRVDYNDTDKFWDAFEHASEFSYGLEFNDAFYVYEHLKSVLDRVKITLDKFKKLQINGKSKYFSAVKIEQVGGKSVIKNCDFEGEVVFLEISKPNRFADNARVKNYGLELLKLARVYKKGEERVVVDEVPDTLNYVVKLPEHKKASIAYTRTEDKVPLNKLQFDGYVSGFLDFKPNKSLKGSQVVDIDFTDEKIQVLGPSTLDLNNDQVKGLYNILTNKNHIIDMPPHSGGFLFLNALLKNLDFQQERTLIVFPHSNWITAFSPSVSNWTSFGDKKDPFQIIETLIKETRTLASKIKTDQDKIDSIQTALEFYKLTVPRVWKQYLELLKTDKCTAYPFDDVNEPEQIISSYKSISSKGDFLKNISSILHFENVASKVREHLVNNVMKFVAVTQDELSTVHGYFDNIIAYEAHRITRFELSDYRRLAIIGDSQTSDENSLMYKAVNSEISSTSLITVTTSKLFELYGERYDVKLQYLKRPHFLQYVKLSPESSNVSVEEAEICLRLKDKLKCKVVSGSLYQQALLKEMSKEDVEYVDDVTPADTIVLSLHGYRSIHEILDCSKMCHRLILVGALRESIGVQPCSEKHIKP